MNTQIKVSTIKEEPSFLFHVTVTNNGTDTVHSVSMSRSYYSGLSTKKQPWEVIEKSFRFLLDKETKEEILAEFDIPIITRYYPEFKDFLKKEL
jgi:hypothetical protein